MNSSSDNNNTDLDQLDTNDLNMSLLANKAKMKEEEMDNFETSIDNTPAFEALDEKIKSDEDLVFNNNVSSEIHEIDEDIISQDSERSGDDETVHINSNPVSHIMNNFSSSPKKESDEKKTYTPREERKRKHELLYKIKALARKGIDEPFAVNMNSKLEDIELAYEEMYANYQRKNSVVLQRKMLVMAATLVEFLNNRYDPCDFKLDGWSESVYDSVNNDEYDEVLEELYEKYKSKTKMAPEMKLLMMLGGSAFMHHTLSSAFKTSARPTAAPQQTKNDMAGPSGLDDILRDFKNDN